jgi:hypothetical protein
MERIQSEEIKELYEKFKSNASTCTQDPKFKKYYRRPHNTNCDMTQP